MSRQMLTVMLGLAVFPFAAIAIAAYVLTTSGPEMTSLAGAIMVLAACLFGLALVVMMKLSRHEEWLASQQETMRDLNDQSHALTARLDDVEQRGAEPARRLDEITTDMKMLRDGIRSLMTMRDKPEPAPRAPAAEMPKAAAQAGSEHLELLLEPVIELATGITSHYRALLNLTDDQGHAVPHAELMQKADQGGMRPALDAHVVKLVAPVLRRLRLKNPGLRVFVPIGLSTLGSFEEAQRILSSLERDVDVAGGMVFEFAHRDLGSLDDAGIQNLARLGRLGATLGLSQVQVAGLDLASLRQLGVRFLTFPPHAVDAGFGPSAAWREFVQYARAMQFQVVVSDIVTAQQASVAGKFGRFGFGSFFAPPRKVRADAGVGASAATRNASAA